MKRTEELKAKIKGMAKVGLDGTPCTHEWNGTTLIVTSASGTSSANLKGDKGDAMSFTDLTEEQKASLKEQIVSDVLNSLPTWEGGSY